MGGRIALVLLACACLGAARLPPDREQWQRATSAHFTFYTNAETSRVRELAASLERLVDLLASRKGSKPSPVPTALYVFRNDRAFQPYKRNRDGSIKNLSGFFARDDLSNYVALDGSAPAPRTVLHEYLHQFSAYNLPPLPAWLEEGLAEFYSTFSVRDGTAQVGRPVQEHVLWLQAHRPMPLAQLFRVTHADPEYNERSKQGAFYAGSWALVHLLLLGDPNRHGQLEDYIGRLAGGQSSVEALSVYGDLHALERQVATYVHRRAVPSRTESYPDGASTVEVAFQPLSREDTLFRLGDLLQRTSELQVDVAEHFRAALAVAPEHAGALAGLALMDVRAGRWDQAAAGFERAVAAAPTDPELRLRLAHALFRAEFQLEPRSPAGKTPPRLLLAREHAFRAESLRPGTFAAAFLVGLTYVFQAREVEPGIAALERAHALAPGRADVLLVLGGLQLVAHRVDGAKASFGTVARSTSEPRERRQALEGLAEVAVAEAFEVAKTTHDVVSAAAAIRSALPELELRRRSQVERELARLEATGE